VAFFGLDERSKLTGRFSTRVSERDISPKRSQPRFSSPAAERPPMRAGLTRRPSLHDTADELFEFAAGTALELARAVAEANLERMSECLLDDFCQPCLSLGVELG